jgi:collagenase-like PrtC family protease
LKKKQYFLKDDEHTLGSCLAVERGYARNNGIVVNLKELNKLFSIGIKHFKIQGREHPFERVLYGALTKYVVQDTIRCICGTNE